MINFIKKHPVWSFLIINYLISWTFLYPSYQLILKHQSITPLSLIGLIGAYGPSIAAIIVQGIIDKKKLKALFRKLIMIKTHFRTILFILFAPIIFYALAYILAILFYQGQFSFNLILGISNLLIWFLAALPFGPMGEELGWRGFMLPKLLEKHSIIKSTILVGLAWGIWHLASFTFPGAAIPDFFELSLWSVLLYFVNTIALSFIFTFIHFKTNGSVFYAILLHAFFNAAFNITSDFLGETDHTSILITSYIINLIIAGICGILLLKSNLNFRGQER